MMTDKPHSRNRYQVRAGPRTSAKSPPRRARKVHLLMEV